MKDTYGSTIREHMKKSLEKPAEFRPLNKREPMDGYDLASLIVAVLASLCLVMSVGYWTYIKLFVQ